MDFDKFWTEAFRGLDSLLIDALKAELDTGKSYQWSYTMNEDTYVGNPLDGMEEEFQGMKEEMMEEEPSSDTLTEGEALDIVQMHSSVMVTANRTVEIDGAFEFPLDYSMMHALIWKPARDGDRLHGTFRCTLVYTWKEGEDYGSDLYYVIQDGGIDKLVPAWSSVDKHLSEVHPDTEVLLIYRGLRQLPNGRTWHNVMVGKAIPPDRDRS